MYACIVHDLGHCVGAVIACGVDVLTQWLAPRA